MDELIRSDLYRYFGKNDRKTFFKGLAVPGFRYSYVLRKCARHKKYSLPGIFFRMLYQRYKYKYGFQIPITTKIGKGLYLGHFGMIVVNGKAIIGDNCNLEHGVTIGQTNRGKMKGSPVIGNNVWIGTGSVLVGNINIGDNVLIAPNSYINSDIPANSLVLSNRALEIIPKENAVEGYVNNPVK
ncbi:MULTISPECIES: serine O-acetyltransferase [Niastella]|uniref:Serine acetyltransferase n=1 Tax=Niastella soli TaxID=2821487 RepID=A0ABS3YLP0_9BACT|nr:serine acetyltransferase [Niastella soli]MBO9198817.1 serine acetyltransferase [Niastella soli]